MGPVAARTIQLLFEPLVERAAVREPGERVAFRAVAELAESPRERSREWHRQGGGNEQREQSGGQRSAPIGADARRGGGERLHGNEPDALDRQAGGACHEGCPPQSQEAAPDDDVRA